jgi:hypothetical protein
MNHLVYSRNRLKAFLDELTRVHGVEFPYEDASKALVKIEATLRRHLSALDALSPQSDPAVTRAACKSASTALVIYLPLLGFILRSTNVRNAFEIHGPLLRLARLLLGPTTQLILSSEWDYSPFTFLNPVLAQYVLIGLPASESANPLLLPLAGHELGHHLWHKESLDSHFSASIQRRIVEQITTTRWNEYLAIFPKVEKATINTDLFAKQTWQPAFDWALRQVEETYCDYIALGLFSESYLHAFAYLIAPSLGGLRIQHYPNNKRRVDHLVQASKALGVNTPDNYQDMFEDLSEPTESEQATKFLVELADEASESVMHPLLEMAARTLAQAQSQRIDRVNATSIYQSYKKHVVPSNHPRTLSDVLNAAWMASHDVDLWKDKLQIEDKERTLKELVLKSIEVLEYNQIVKGDIAIKS